MSRAAWAQVLALIAIPVFTAIAIVVIPGSEREEEPRPCLRQEGCGPTRVPPSPEPEPGPQAPAAPAVPALSGTAVISLRDSNGKLFQASVHYSVYTSLQVGAQTHIRAVVCGPTATKTHRGGCPPEQDGETLTAPDPQAPWIDGGQLLGSGPVFASLTGDPSEVRIFPFGDYAVDLDRPSASGAWLWTVTGLTKGTTTLQLTFLSQYGDTGTFQPRPRAVAHPIRVQIKISPPPAEPEVPAAAPGVPSSAQPRKSTVPSAAPAPAPAATSSTSPPAAGKHARWWQRTPAGTWWTIGIVTLMSSALASAWKRWRLKWQWVIAAEVTLLLTAGLIWALVVSGGTLDNRLERASWIPGGGLLAVAAVIVGIWRWAGLRSIRPPIPPPPEEEPSPGDHRGYL